jgi:elongation factor Ts
VPESVIEKEKEILTAQALNEGKPAAVAEKMVVGRIAKYYKEICLLDQPFVKDAEITVGKLMAEKGKEIGTEIDIIAFSRFEKGEGLQKREDDFASEVQSMIK